MREEIHRISIASSYRMPCVFFGEIVVIVYISVMGKYQYHRFKQVLTLKPNSNSGTSQDHIASPWDQKVVHLIPPELEPVINSRGSFVMTISHSSHTYLGN